MDVEGRIASGTVIEEHLQDVSGSIPWMESVESSLERRPRKRLEQVFQPKPSSQRKGKRHIDFKPPVPLCFVKDFAMSHIMPLILLPTQIKTFRFLVSGQPLPVDDSACRNSLWGVQ